VWRAHACVYSLRHWSTKEVAFWLKCDLKLPDVAESFETVFEVDGAQVSKLDKPSLEAFGVEEAHHETILAAIKVEGRRKSSMADRAKPAFEIIINQELRDCANMDSGVHKADARLVRACLCSASWVRGNVGVWILCD